MDINELENCEMNPALAYALGLMFPLYTEKKLADRKYILGSINHNPQKITQDEINQHFLAVKKLFEKYENTKNILIKTNKCSEYKLSSKQGFSILIDNTNITKEESINIMTKRVEQIKESTENIKIQFVKGCFDGRSSWDKTAHLLSIDVDEDHEKQNLIRDIIRSLGLDVNVNNRDENDSRHDQIRIKRNSIKLYMEKVNFYSTCRVNIVNTAINI